MGSILLILFFTMVMTFFGVYIITRQMFKEGSKKAALFLSALVTILLVVILLAIMTGTVL